MFLENAIKGFIAASPDNKLSAFHNIPLFDDSLVGFVDGDDAIFEEYKKIIGSFHFTPGEVMELYLRKKDAVKQQLRNVSVIACVFTTPYEVRLSLRRETLIASLMANRATWEGKDFLHDKMLNYVISLLEGLGYQAVAPSAADFFKWIELPDGPSSNWSETHVAYAAGLGTFGLSGGLITPRGIAVHCMSVVTDLALPSSPRLHKNHLANCLFFRNGSCRRCIERCPSGAISEQGYNKKKCHGYHVLEQPEIWKRLERGTYIGLDPSCGLCQTKVPCESRIPPIVPVKNQ
ncbi:MAG: hypothetical protein A2144_09660 [Chloroflexi bacterium RBG_16_50_9]|nr:MAG: hypothetical protein A2144_09660 [Chloroflexi bacterium RBG_16_50_9]